MLSPRCLRGVRHAGVRPAVSTGGGGDAVQCGERAGGEHDQSGQEEEGDEQQGKELTVCDQALQGDGDGQAAAPQAFPSAHPHEEAPAPQAEAAQVRRSPLPHSPTSTTTPAISDLHMLTSRP